MPDDSPGLEKMFTCPRGHRWQPSGDAPADPAQLVCPTCGEPTGLTIEEVAGTDLPDAAAATVGLPPVSDAVAPPRLSAAASAWPTVAGYEILAVLGQGGMGVVYKARQARLKRLVALKMIRAGDGADAQAVARFRIEAEAVARLDHPHIVQIHEVGEQDGSPYFSLEFIDGGSLAEQLRGTPMPAAKAARLVETLARAMDYAHQHGIVHRDLKPANVLLMADGTPKIADFGLAKQLEDDSHQTQTGAILGTPSYMAPEQARADHRQIGPATDVYALGAILYELLTGRPPFRATTKVETIMQVATEEPVPPTRLQSTVPRDLETICLKCLHKEPGKRYAGARSLAEDLRRFQANEPIQARPVGVWERGVKWAKRRPAVAALLALVVLVTLVGFSLVTWAWHVAEGQRQQAERARALEASQRRQFQRLSTGLLVDRGQDLCQQEDVGRGLSWLARSLQVAGPEDADLQAVIRTSMAGWHGQFHSLRALFGHPRAVRAAAFSPDGKLIVTGSNDGTTRFWDAATGTLIDKTLPHNDGGWIIAVAFSPDGKTLLTGTARGSARLWDVATGQPRGPVLVHDEGLDFVAFSPDGTTFVTRTAGKRQVRLWNTDTQKAVREPLPGQVLALAYRPDGKMLLTGHADNMARCWDPATGQALGAPLPHPQKVDAVAFSPNSKTFATGVNRRIQRWDTATRQPLGEPLLFEGVPRDIAFSPDGKLLLARLTLEVRLWVTGNGKPMGPSLIHRGFIRSAVFSPDGKMVLTGSDDQSARLWDTATGSPIGAPLPHASRVWVAAFNPDGRTVLTTGEEGNARLWEVPGNSLPGPSLPHPRYKVAAVAFSPDGQTVLTGDRGGTARLWQAATGQPIGPRLQHEAAVTVVGFSPDGRTALTASDDRTVRFWDTATAQPLGTPLRHDDVIFAAAFSPDGKTVATGSRDRTARLWQTATCQPIGKPLTHDSFVWAVAFSPDGRTVLTGSDDDTARLWDAATGEPRAITLRHAGTVFAVAFSPDGKTVVTGSSDRTARLWDAATGTPIGQPLTHHLPVRVVGISPDGRTVLTGSDDGTARLWDTATGLPRVAPLTHRSRVTAAVFSPDGTRILTGSQDHTAQLWDTATGKPLGPAFTHRLPVYAVAFRPDGKTVVTGSQNLAHLWPIPAPLSGDVERIVRWVQVLSGLELEADGTVGVLDGVAWRARRQRLKELGGSPLP